MKVAFLHPIARSYRNPLFIELSKKIDGLTVIFTCGSKLKHPNPAFKEDIKKSLQILEKERVEFKVFEDIPNPLMGEEFNPALLLELKKYDVIITSIPYRFGSIAAYAAAKLFGKRLICWDETWKFPENRKYGAVRPIFRKIIAKADACIVPGEAAKRFYLENGCPENKIIVSGNACPPPPKPEPGKIAEIRKRHNVEGKTVFVYMGRVVPYKGLDVLIKAFGEADCPDSFLLIGGSGEAAFEEKCRKIAPKNVAFAESVPDSEKSSFICAGDFFVLPSRFMMGQNQCCESWGFTLNEAAYLGRGLISTDAVGAAYELIEEGENGFFAKAGDAESLAEALKKACSSDARGMGRKSREIVGSQNYGRMVSAFTEAIKKVGK